MFQIMKTVFQGRKQQKGVVSLDSHRLASPLEAASAREAP